MNFRKIREFFLLEAESAGSKYNETEETDTDRKQKSPAAGSRGKLFVEKQRSSALVDDFKADMVFDQKIVKLRTEFTDKCTQV